MFGTTIKRQLYATDTEDRYFHLYYSEQKASAEREQLEAKIERMKKCLDQWKGQTRTISEGFKTYFNLEIYDKDGTFLFAREKEEAIIEEKRLCGYYVIVTSARMSAREALELYKSRDASEKLFREVKISPIWGIRVLGHPRMKQLRERSLKSLWHLLSEIHNSGA